MDSVNDGQYIAAISLDARGAFDAARWPGILAAMRKLRCPGNLYRLSESFFSEKNAFLTMNTCTVPKKIRKECPQGSTSGPGFWNLLYKSLLN